MQPLKEIGEFKIIISDSGEEFFFKPSFENIMKLGGPREIVETYAILNGFEINKVMTKCLQSIGTVPQCVLKSLKSKTYGGNILSTAMFVLDSCCYSDATPLIGYYKLGKNKMIYQAGLMPIDIIIANARNLLEHGIIGKANLKVAARDERGFSNEFNAMEYITSARVNFGMNLQEARALSMTELHLLIKQKYPPAKGFTREEREQLAAEYKEKRDQDLGIKTKTAEWKKISLNDFSRSKK